MRCFSIRMSPLSATVARQGSSLCSALRGQHRRAASTSTQKEATLKHVPFGEAGSGFYSDATKGCFDVMDRLKPLAMKELQGVLEHRRKSDTANQVFRLLDIGTADAGTSLLLVRDIIKAVREAEPEAPIEVVYEDQAHNDWASVFHRTQGTIPTIGAEAGLSDFKDVFVFASGQSFFKSVAVPRTVDFTISSTAMHWLTSSPSTIPDALHSACSQDAATLAAFEEQAHRDWTSIMSARASELREGGAMVVANFCKDNEGQFLGHTPNRVKHSMHHTFAKIWQELVTPAEFDNTNFPNQYRSLAACTRIFEEGSGVFEGMELSSAETAVVPCPFVETYRANPDAIGNKEQAERYVGTTRTWSNSTFLAGLDDSKSQGEKEQLVDTLFSRYVDEIAKEPAEHAMDYVHSYLAFVKR